MKTHDEELHFREGYELRFICDKCGGNLEVSDDIGVEKAPARFSGDGWRNIRYLRVRPCRDCSMLPKILHKKVQKAIDDALTDFENE